MEAPMDSWEERRGAMTPGEAYRCWLFGEGLEAGKEALAGKGALPGALPGKGTLAGKDEARRTEERAGRPVPTSSRSKKGFTRAQVEAVLNSGGKLSRADLLRCRVRWFSAGAAIGSKGFVERVFQGCRSHFGPKRKSGARRVREDAAGSLHALRELKVSPVGITTGN
jgi:hypothetical protein